MTNYKFTLDPGSKKHTCPDCGQKRFVRYIDTVSGHFLPSEYGRCDREDSCGYHLSPYENAARKEHTNLLCMGYKTEKSFKEKPTSYISADIFSKSLNRGTDNNFITYLKALFSVSEVERLIERYHIGTSEHWPSATVFWQVDRANMIRTGKVMLYDSETGRRIKEPFNHVNWIHSILQLKPFNLKQCLFGEHLLKELPNHPVAITESEKSAIIASTYFPDLIWLATGQKNGLLIEKFQVLSGRKVVLFPDLGAYDIWKAKAQEIKQHIPNISITTNDLLEKNASKADKDNGFDIADYLIRYSFNELERTADQQNQSIEPFCYEDRKRNPWPNSKYWTMKLTHYPCFEAVWETVEIPGKGCKTRFIEQRKIDHDAVLT